MSETEPPTIGAPIAAVPLVVTVGVLPAELLADESSPPPPPHAASAAHSDAPSARLVIPMLNSVFFTTGFPFWLRWWMDFGTSAGRCSGSRYVVFTRQKWARDRYVVIPALLLYNGSKFSL
ncbi:hypothetical protein [Paraburkholderia sp. J41]|uniref:hypothetical protein n=1 Tax=Paraburkholderia sp. J41 TaxID=2805433 RepID=UPI002AC33BD1|nr:hypothetical protein [Paraburkholderia sp. J41]